MAKWKSNALQATLTFNSTFPDSVDPRYRLDPMNLSLIIDDVRRSDSIQDYHCDLQVVDPRSRNTYGYTVASYVNISLTVLCKWQSTNALCTALDLWYTVEPLYNRPTGTKILFRG